MLGGMAWLHGRLDTLDLVAMGAATSSVSPETAARVLVALTVVLAGAGLKMLTLPLALWGRMAHGGPAVSLVAFMALAAKASVFGLVVRVLATALGHPQAGGGWGEPEDASWPLLLLLVGMVALALGTAASIREHGLVRLLSETSVAQAGLALFALALPREECLRAMLVLLAADGLSGAGAFLAVSALVEARGDDRLDSCRGLARDGGLLGRVTAFFTLSLVGLPPTVGFVARLHLFAGVLREGAVDLAALGIVAVVASLFAWGRVVQRMLADPEEPPIVVGLYNRILLGALAAFVLALGVWWPPLLGLAHRSIRMFDG